MQFYPLEQKCATKHLGNLLRLVYLSCGKNVFTVLSLSHMQIIIIVLYQMKWRCKFCQFLINIEQCVNQCNENCTETILLGQKDTWDLLLNRVDFQRMTQNVAILKTLVIKFISRIFSLEHYYISSPSRLFALQSSFSTSLPVGSKLQNIIAHLKQVQKYLIC